ncbi:MAG: 6,7-dimethyl-8-ribityllumazine synthase [Bacteroidales bacterium]|jgi:6,7-dimethyl-8-ribityllumazine synthase (EC 2.5.1.9) |nr:6,7-dimethyl-8-ribityllumazine synthase [Bacteroidales bacterium]HOA09645.1 6,7-dimethyl-8-ribityllumazine synthase [Tenuifilaceae bacterium]MBP8643562.1 6,7-dimethyl-8-ribityllumazine synthase [Bacteroidales bacterium]NLI87051.1 6,7-dimethyl-8-ribityllumazine synthase [Bacteroidales bacterium]HOC36586.1 6,7-dimethyl-8-ribityllumazine synthase [Tenuifilaceae bacterium]
MATKLKNLSAYDPAEIPSAKKMKFGIVVSDWNEEVTKALLEGAYQTLIGNGVKEDNILVKHVPGAFELTLGAQFMAEYADLDGVICLGCVIQGETRHFDFICQSVTQGITQLNMDYNIPFIFGLLTTENLEQALERAGGKHGNKGVEAAITAIKMAHLQQEMEQLEG